MRHTEFWARMELVLGVAYAPVWARTQVLADLDGRTVQEALDSGVPPKAVWRSVCESLSLPESQR
jgi:hypothetical protein